MDKDKENIQLLDDEDLDKVTGGIEVLKQVRRIQKITIVLGLFYFSFF